MSRSLPRPRPIFDSLSHIRGRRARQSLLDSVDAWFAGKPIRGARDDLASALGFLLSYDGTPATFNAYRRDVERLLQWSWSVHKSSAHRLEREHIVEFISFVQDPPESWIGLKNVARFKSRAGERVPNPEWRPFVVAVSKSQFKRGIRPDVKNYRPSAASVQATFAILSSFYDYLTQEDWVDANPVALIRQKSKFLRRSQNRAPVRRISELQWDYVLETAEIMAADDPSEHERTLFVMTALYAMYLRISELVADGRSTPTMGDFQRDRDGSWWFHVIGKGNKDRTVAVSDKMLDALRRYRNSLELTSDLPTPGETTPLVSKTHSKGSVRSTRWIRSIVQQCFDLAHDRMVSEGLGEDAAELKEATVHWLRHTGISQDVVERPREHVRDDAGHASMATTDRYIESDQRERHLSGRGKRMKIFDEN